MPKKITKKATTKKPAPKKTAKKTAKKPIAKKSAAKKVSLEKANTRKSVTQKISPKKEQKKAESKKPAVKNYNSTSPLVVTLLCLAFLLSGSSLSFSIYNYLKSNNGVFEFNNSAQFTEGSIADVANRVSKSVVSILTETRTASFYGQSSTGTAAGTGMIVTADGYVLTNKHVAEGAKSYKIIMDDGTSYSDVKLMGADPLNDVAFLKINNVSDLKPITLGDSKTLSVGQQVITIGNALGQYQNSVASGIISGTGRSIIATDASSYNYERLSDLIQTDAAINSGNSGGPLVNAAGEVVGINTATSSYGDNIGFAIPISSIKGMLKSIINTGNAERAYIGVAYLAVTAEVKESYGLDVDYGAYLAEPSSIIAGGPAEKAGLKAGDIILAINGVNIGKAGSLSTLIGEYATGETVEVKYRRDGQEYTTSATLEAYKTTGEQS